ncbi:MAG: InlB B-repeat-containing protein [Eubacterium sp.]|nr:InlB B-repeat-containing protein [Eubacterium sp.]
MRKRKLSILIITFMLAMIGALAGAKIDAYADLIYISNGDKINADEDSDDTVIIDEGKTIIGGDLDEIKVHYGPEKVLGASMSFDKVEFHKNTKGIWEINLDYFNYVLDWENGKESTRDADLGLTHYIMSSLYSDETCSQLIKADSGDMQDSFFLLIDIPITTDLTNVTTKQCSLTLPTYSAECIKVYQLYKMEKSYIIPAQLIMTFKVQRTAHNVDFNLNGFGEYPPQSQTVSVGGKATEPQKVYGGKRVIGWYTEPACTNRFDFDTVITKDMTLYAKWEDIDYKISFNANGGSGTIAPIYKHYKDTFVLPECTFQAPLGKVFDKWNYGAPGKIVSVGMKDIEVKAVWTAAKVYFDANGGTGTMADKTVSSSGKVVLPECGFTAPANKVFAGWDLGKPGDEVSVIGDTTAKALWTDKIYDISFWAGNGTGSMDSVQAVSGSNYKIPNCDFSAPSGKVFDCWAVSLYVDDKYAENLGKYYPGQSINITGDLRMIAQWKTDTDIVYAVFFMPGDGTGEAVGIEVRNCDINDTNLTLPSCIYNAPPATQNGEEFEFAGWKIDGQIYQPGRKIRVTSSDIQVVAQWKKKTYYTVTFNSSYGEVPAAQKIEAGGYATKPEDPTETGWIFTGWMKSYPNLFDFSQPVTEDVTLYAGWESKSYHVSVETDGNGTAYSEPETTSIGSDVTIRYTPDEGYELDEIRYSYIDSESKVVTESLGALTSRFKMPAADVNVSVFFKPKSYSIGVGVVQDGDEPAHGTVSSSHTKAEKDTEVTINAYPDTGYRFKGWKVDLGGVVLGDETSESTSFVVGTSNVYVYAEFEPVLHTVTFDSRGGSAVDSQTILSGTTVTKPADPTKEGNTFEGWCIDSELKYVYNFESQINNDITLYARWKKDVTPTATPTSDPTSAPTAETTPTPKTDPSAIPTSEVTPTPNGSSTPEVTPSPNGSATPAASPTPGVVTRSEKEISPEKPAKIVDVEKTILSVKDEKDTKGSTFTLLKAKGTPKSKKSIKLSWSKVPGAEKYMIYGNKCGKKNKYKYITTVTGTSYTAKKLKKGTYYKYTIVAVKGDEAIATSKTIHVVTDGGKKGNNTKVKLSKTKLSLAKGKSKTIKAKLKSKKKVSIHRKVAWESDNLSVAKVNSKGKITAVGKGTCYVYAYAQNGVAAKIKVTVK